MSAVFDSAVREEARNALKCGEVESISVHDLQGMIYNEKSICVQCDGVNMVLNNYM